MVEFILCEGVIRKTKIVMECLHRFCGECIEKAIRLWLVLKLRTNTLSSLRIFWDSVVVGFEMFELV